MSPSSASSRAGSSAGRCASRYGQHADSRDPAGETTVGRAPGKYRTAEEICARLLLAEPHATAERREQLVVAAKAQVRTADLYWDATFSVSKSVSPFHASGSPMPPQRSSAATASLPPARSRSPMGSGTLSLLALKLTRTRRVSHVDDLLADPAAGLLAGLAVLPTKFALTDYSYRLSHDHQRKFLAALDQKIIDAGLAAGDQAIFDLDFHAVMHWGADPAMGKHTSRSAPSAPGGC
jgi:hypothetical protein